MLLLQQQAYRQAPEQPFSSRVGTEGKRVYELPALNEIKEYTKENLDSLWEEYKRDLNPQKYPVDLSTECWNHKMAIMERMKKSVAELHTEA